MAFFFPRKVNAIINDSTVTIVRTVSFPLMSVCRAVLKQVLVAETRQKWERGGLWDPKGERALTAAPTHEEARP